MTLGTDWKSRVRDKVDLEITAYHEAGHTLVAYLTPDTTPLHKVSIRDKIDIEITAYHEAGHTLVAYLTPDTTPLHKVRIRGLTSKRLESLN